MSSSGSTHEEEAQGAGTRFVYGLEGADMPPIFPLSQYATLEDLEEPIHTVNSADELLQWGIANYTFIPGPAGVLGRGRFSVVYRVMGLDGQEYALKHTPLYPHHPLISARLLREPNLLAQLPPHPCLVRVKEWIRSHGHFYLIEMYSKDHIPLSELATPIDSEMGEKILDQLVSVVRDCLHRGRVCHRDLKPENVLVNSTGDIIVLDLGLATQYSASQPSLTTCCGSPAFHSPEIIDALNHSPGTIRYYGPELDIWCIGLILLALLTGDKYPIGAKHRDLDTMRRTVKKRLRDIEWVSDKLHDHLEAFLDIDGDRRMEAFDQYTVDQTIQTELNARTVDRQSFKSITFIADEAKYCLRLTPLETADCTTLRLLNEDAATPRQVISCVKYMLRSAGILMHSLTPADASTTLLQCVLTLESDSPYVPRQPIQSRPSFLANLLGSNIRRANSAPAGVKSHTESAKGHCIRFYLIIDCGVAEDIEASEAMKQLEKFCHEGEPSKDMDASEAMERPPEICQPIPTRKALMHSLITRSRSTRPAGAHERFVSARQRSHSRRRSPLSRETRNNPSIATQNSSPASGLEVPEMHHPIDRIITIRVSDSRTLPAIRQAIFLPLSEPSLPDKPQTADMERGRIQQPEIRGRTTERRTSEVEIAIASPSTPKIDSKRLFDEKEIQVQEVQVQEVQVEEVQVEEVQHRKGRQRLSIMVPDTGWFGTVPARPEYIVDRDRSQSMSPGRINGMLMMRN